MESKKLNPIPGGLPALTLVILFSCLAVWPAGAQESPQNSLGAAASVLEEYARTVPLPGFSAVIAGRSGVLWTGAWGRADLQTGEPFSDRTLVPMGSITKSLTALAVMQLAEEKLINLDDPVVRYLDWFRLADKGVSDRITLRHCLTNTSGIPSIDRWQTMDPTLDESVMESEIRLLSGVRSRSEPGKSFEYVNENWTILGLVVKKIRGTDFGTALQDWVLDPLGMYSTTTIPARLVQEKRVAGSLFTQDGFSPARGQVTAGAMPAGSSLVSQARDFGTYLGFLLSGGLSPVTGRRIISKEGLSLLLRPAVSFPVFPQEFEGGDKPGYYAMGWICAEVDGRTLYFHGGNTGRTTTMTVFDPAAGFGAALLANSPGELDRYRFESFLGVLNRVLHTLEGSPSTLWGKPLQPDPHRREVPINPGREWITALTGPWVSPEGSRLEIRAPAGEGYLTGTVESRIFTGTYRIDFLDRSRVVLSNLSGTLTARFETGADGKVSRFRGPLGQEFIRWREPEASGPTFRLGTWESYLPRGWQVLTSEGGLSLRAESPAESAGKATLRAGSFQSPADLTPSERFQRVMAVQNLTDISPDQVWGAWTGGRYWESIGISARPAPGRTGVLTWTQLGSQVCWIYLEASPGSITGEVRKVLRPLLQGWKEVTK